jgi:hypothetical protein
MQIAKICDLRIASKLQRSRLDKLREEMSIPPRELNVLVKDIINREFGDVRFLTEGESRKVVAHLKERYAELSERYRRMKWA